jgi:acyl carrier protein
MAASEITDYIINVLVDKYGYPEAELEIDTSFETLDFDSLVLTELAGLLNRAFGIDLVDDELAEAGCIDAVGLLAEERMSVADGLVA